MSENKKQDPKESAPANNEEKTLNFEAAKDMTIGQVARKQKEMQDGVEADDSILDRYIKQHREDIEAKKFDTIADAAPINEEVLDEEAAKVQAVEEESAEITEVQEPVQADSFQDVEPEPELQIHKVETPKVAPSPEPMPVAEGFSELDEAAMEEENTESTSSNSRKIFIWLGLAAVFVCVLAATFIWMNSSTGNQNTTSSSSTSQTSSSSEDANVTAFETLYASFFTDSSQTKLKNSEFGNLAQLKAALDKIGTSNEGYKAAKAKYDTLEKAIQAIQDINNQFDKPAIVDGELDTTATVKSGASFTAVTTGLSALDTLLTSAINLGRTQTPASSAAQAETPAANTAAQPATSAATEQPSASAVTSPAEGGIAGSSSIYGIAIPAGVQLQRDLSRVPYNQSAIDDVNNEAWNFNPGVLERIIAVSQERGYVTGNQYILEKVNIINGNGYYNLFRPDGTYLFSINCKTGYFVGNGAGYADDLDY